MPWQKCQESPRVVRFKQLDAIVLGESLGKEGIPCHDFARHWEILYMVLVAKRKFLPEIC